MLVLMLTSSWPLFPGDYRGCFVEELALEMVGRGVDVTVAVPRPVDTAVKVPEYRNGPGSLAVRWLPGFLPGRSGAFHGSGIEANLRARPWTAFSIPPALVSFAAECSMLAPFADLIVSNWVFPMGLVGHALSRLSGRPHALIAHSSPPLPARMPLLSTVVRSVVGSAASVACVSPGVRDDFAAFRGSDDGVEFMPLGIDLRPCVLKQTAADRPLALFFAGRMVPIKGGDLLIRALRGVEGCELTLAGDGPCAGSWKRLAEKTGVPVTFTGSMAREDVRRRMSAADLLVVPSRKTLTGREEGLPRVLVEAWSCGLPVVASDSGGMACMIDRFGGGHVFPAGDTAALRGLLSGLASDRARLAELRECAMKAGTGLSWTRLGPRWVEWLSASLNRGA